MCGPFFLAQVIQDPIDDVLVLNIRNDFQRPVTTTTGFYSIERERSTLKICVGHGLAGVHTDIECFRSRKSGGNGLLDHWILHLLYVDPERQLSRHSLPTLAPTALLRRNERGVGLISYEEAPEQTRGHRANFCGLSAPRTPQTSC
jgi:hypothetical protein